MIWVSVALAVAWFLHVQAVKRRAKRDLLNLVALQLKCTGRTPWVG